MPPKSENRDDWPGLTRRGWLHAAGAMAWPWAPAVGAEPQAARVALVIGNAAYPTSPLRNPGRDARAVADLLGRLGFEVIEERDASRERMQAALARVGAALRGRAGVGLLYFAGHGVQIDWRNFLLPVDARLAGPEDVVRECVDVQQVLGTFRAAGARMNILILDACRDNPFGGAGPRGLAPMDAPPGTFYAYATAPGNVAEDGSEADGNGLYTRFLIGELQKSGARIEDVFKRVRLQVRQATQGRQIPWESTSLEEDFVFATGERLAAPTTREREREFDTQRDEWDRIRESTQATDFFAFLQRHPTGPFAELAQFTLDRLARPVLVAQAPQALQRLVALPPGVDRYRVGDGWEALVTDHVAGGPPQSQRARVVSIEGGRVLVNRGQLVFDQMGNTLLNRFGRKEPGVQGAPADLAVGKRWRTAFTNHPLNGGPSERNFYDCHVSAIEDVEVPAGKFRTYRVERKGEAVRWNGARRLVATDWIDPQTMWRVKWTLHHSDLNKGWVEQHQSGEVTAFYRVPR